MSSFPSAEESWRRGIVYTVVCVALGVTALVATSAPVLAREPDELGWWLWTAACFVVAVVGYWVIWPLGTLSHGRPLVASATVFGLLWGLAEGLLFVAAWLAVSSVVSSTWLAVAVTFVVLSAYLGLWHQLYWDRHVSPDHNIEEWNARKVLLVHVPNLLVTLPYLAVTGSVAVFVATQVVALVGSARAMHFSGFPGWRNTFRV